ncbi:MAG: hypothetical protein J7641_18290 [Cyanobacteria bacterium SID2]|nr:hypothetical protein [Cyanobacteria bacterium SID2]MBP0005427.1 hypothetical protein [Cyanobacteria bacterium SBC]
MSSRYAKLGSIEFGDEVSLQPDPLQHRMVTLTGDVLRFDRRPLEEAVSVVGDRYGVGTLTVKTVRMPSPW